MVKAHSTDPIREETEELENMKIASFSMENIIDKTFNDITDEKNDYDIPEGKHEEKEEESQVYFIFFVYS